MTEPAFKEEIQNLKPQVHINKESSHYLIHDFIIVSCVKYFSNGAGHYTSNYFMSQCLLGSFNQTTASRKVMFGFTATGNSGDSYSLNRMELAECKWTTEVGRSGLVDVAIEDMGHAAEQTLATCVSVIQLCTPTSPKNVSAFGLLLVFPFHRQCQKEQHILVVLEHVRLQ